MKRLVVNAFCPKEHKVVSRPEATPDLPLRVNRRAARKLCLAIWIKIREVKAASAGQIQSFRAVAQLGRAPGSGPGGRGFKSHQPDLADAASEGLLAAASTEVSEERRLAQTPLHCNCRNAFSMHSTVTIVGVVIGIAILFFGRKLFWLCVAAVGFAVGVEIAPLLVNEASSMLALVIALVFGLLGALLALFLQKIAIAILGFLAGGKLATAIAASFFVHYAQYSTIIFVIGGVIGAILLLAVFGWALIVVSSFIGAYLIESAIVLPPTGSTLVFIGLAILGIFVQAASFRRSVI